MSNDFKMRKAEILQVIQAHLVPFELDNTEVKEKVLLRLCVSENVNPSIIQICHVACRFTKSKELAEVGE